MVLVVQGSSPYRTLADLIGAARERPGELSLGAAPASSLQVAFEVIKRSTGATMTFVPFPGTAPAINTLMGGHVTVEAAVAAYDADIFYGLVAPAKSPPDALAQLSDWFGRALKASEVQPRLAQQGLFPVGMCGAPFGEFLRRQVNDYSRIIRETGIKAN
jgi:tripartite-type tricarboxylate transporter receptor subunit TctC